MKKYKLIYKYPGSAPVDTIAVEEPLGNYVTESVTEGLNIYEKEEIENYPEYWEKIKELEFKSGDWVITTQAAGGEYYCKPDAGEVFKVQRIKETSGDDNLVYLFFNAVDAVVSDRCRLADKREIENALLEEAKKKGLVHGVRYKCAKDGDNATLQDRLRLNITMDMLTDGCGGAIYYDGKWAEIITPITFGEHEAIWDRSFEHLKVGCKTYTQDQVIGLRNAMKNLDIEQIQIKGLTVLYSQVEQLVAVCLKGLRLNCEI